MSATSGHFVKISSMVDGTLRLTIDVTKEHATEALTTLGFPVGQAVAVTLLHETAAASPSSTAAEVESRPTHSIPAERGGKPRTPVTIPTVGRGRVHNDARRPWHELTRAQQAGIRCGEERFFTFLQNKYLLRMRKVDHDPAEFVRQHCLVATRANLDVTDVGASRWDALDAEYRRWSGLEAEAR